MSNISLSVEEVIEYVRNLDKNYSPLAQHFPSMRDNTYTYSDDRFDCEKKPKENNYYIHDKLTGYDIVYSDENGYDAYSAGQKIYTILPDGRAKFYYNKGYYSELIDGSFTIDDMMGEHKLTTSNPTDEILIIDGRLVKIKSVLNETTYYETYYNDSMVETKYALYINGSLSKVEYYQNDGSTLDYIEYPTGEKEYYRGGKIYKIVKSSGEIIVGGDLEQNYNNIFLRPDGTYSIVDSNENGSFIVDSSGNIICTDEKGNVRYYNQYGEIYKRVDNDGKEYSYDFNKYSQKTITLDGKTSYSMINHIEYDEETYNNILTTLNELAGKQEIFNSSILNINDSFSSLPDKYSSNSKISSNIADHLKLIDSLGEMTNYSLLAYQTCDETLKEGLYLLVDSLFGDNETNLASSFKRSISGLVEDNNFDDILEYKKNTNFKFLSENAIVASKYVDKDNNIWYLNKNNRVVDLEGNNPKINYGGEEFSVSYENGTVILKDSHGDSINIFGDYNLDSKQYGGDQQDVKKSMNNAYVNLILDKYIPDAPNEVRSSLLSNIASSSCGKVAITNLVFKKFEGRESEFQNTFGYPMYEIVKTNTGFSLDYNYEPLIVDLCCNTQNVEYNNNMLIGVTNQYEGKLGNNAFGTPIENRDSMEEYLKNEYNVTLDGYDEPLVYRAESRYSLYTMDGELFYKEEDFYTAHAMLEVGRTEGGRPIVSSWGQKLILVVSTAEDAIKCGEHNMKEYI